MLDASDPPLSVRWPSVAYESGYVKLLQHLILVSALELGIEEKNRQL
jgi:hypothetical protein